MSQQQSKTRKTAFAIGAVIALVAVAFAAAMYFPTDAETADSHAAGAETDPAATLAALGAPLPSVDASAATSAAAAAQADAGSRVAAARAEAEGRVTAEADAVLTGADGGVDRALGMADTYGVGALRGQIEGAAGTEFTWQSMPTNVELPSDSVELDETGTAEVDDALGQLEEVLAQVQGTWNSAEVQTVFATAEGAGAPVPGLVQSPFGADDAVEPNEDGAVSAQGHADFFLSTVGSAYGDLGAGLEQIETVQGELPGRVDAAYSQADDFAAQADARIEAEYEARLAAAEQAAADYRARVEAAADTYVSTVEAQAENATSDLQAEIVAQQAALEGAAADARGEIEGRVGDVRAEADSRLALIADLEAQVQAAADAGDIAQADAEAFFAASAAAKANIESQVSGAEAEAAAAIAQLESDVETQRAALEAELADAQAEIDARVADARAYAEVQKASLTGEIDGALAAALAAQAEARASAEAAVSGYVATYKADVHARAMDIIAEARAQANMVHDSIPDVQAEAYSEISKDMAFIDSVIEDYNSIPTPERQAAAEAWAAVNGEIESTLGGALGQGAELQAQADAVLAAAASAEAALN